ncbi:MAG: shikimate kinase II [Desulfovibrio sp.]|jgi:shikimate kinase|nr:shikimate kinase II [Desulfovibrio sp.]
MNILLIGFKSCGKSTLGARLASLGGRVFLDADTLVEDLVCRLQGARLSCREIYARFGASFFRDMETRTLRTLSRLDNAVIATGGGVVLRPENIPLLQAAGLCVFLDLPLPVLARRLQGQADSPLFRERGIAAVYEERRPLYLAAARLCLSARGDETADSLARALVRRIREEGHGQ